MASKALTERAVIARARNYGLDVEEERCDVDELAKLVGKLDSLPVASVSPQQVKRLVEQLNLGEHWDEAFEEATRPRIRRAVVRAVKSRSEVEAYLPTNYRVVGELPCQQTRFAERVDLWVEGEDDHGWTLDGYVIPRLASGLIFAEEVKP